MTVSNVVRMLIRLVLLVGALGLAFWLGTTSSALAWDVATTAAAIGPWILCGAIGALTGTVELVQRYSRGTALGSLLTSGWAIGYLAVNTSIALIVLLLCSLNALPGIDLALTTAGQKFGAAVIAGLMGMVLLRSALVSIKIQDRDYPIGLGLLLDVLIEQMDHRLDQSRAIASSGEVFQIMKDVDAAKAAISLAPLAFQLLERTSEKTLKEVDQEIQAILKDQMPNRTKSMLIGVAIQKIAGIKVLRHAAESLGEEILVSASDDAEYPSRTTLKDWSTIDQQLFEAKGRLLQSSSDKATR